MKFSNFKTLLIALFIGMISVNVFAQAKKPRLVVIPSDALMQQMGLYNETDDMGISVGVPDYPKAFMDIDLKACVNKINEIFNDRGFPLTKLEEELKRVRGKGLVIPVDIKPELTYKITKQGPRDVLYFDLAASDAYSNKQVAASSGQSKPAIGETKVNLLQEAVLDKIDKFVLDIDNYFTKLGETGRESRLTIESDGIELPEELEDAVDAWMNKNCVNASFSIDEVDEMVLMASQAMMPLYDESGKALDARNFYKGLAEELNAKFPDIKFSVKRSSKNSQSGGGTLGDGFILASERID